MSVRVGATVRIFTTTPDTSVYLTATRPFLDHALTAPTSAPPAVSETPQSPQTLIAVHLGTATHRVSQL